MSTVDASSITITGSSRFIPLVTPIQIHNMPAHIVDITYTHGTLAALGLWLSELQAHVDRLEEDAG